MYNKLNVSHYNQVIDISLVLQTHLIQQLVWVNLTQYQFQLMAIPFRIHYQFY